jgi:hypothetical protein
VGKFALLNVTSWVGGYDFTSDTNKAELTTEADALDATTFGSNGYKELVAGLRTAEFSLEGLWDSGVQGVQGSVDPEAFAAIGAAEQVHTVALTGTETQPCYAFRAGRFAYSLLGEVGQIAPFTLKSRGAGGYGVVRGQIAKAKGSVNATGVLGSVLNLGAPTASQRVYAGLHVFGTPGSSLTVQLQSDDAPGFPSPTTRGTIGPLTAAGGTWMTPVPGPFTGELYWRLNVSAISGTFAVAGFIAVQ